MKTLEKGNPLPSAKTLRLTRREFLDLGALGAAAMLLPHSLFQIAATDSSISAQALRSKIPSSIRRILDAVPRVRIDEKGNLLVYNAALKEWLPALQVPTLWNQEHQRPVDRLQGGTRWGIVLHWFGDTEGVDMSLDAYLRGFNALRRVFDYETRTSAHFLVGSSPPVPARETPGGIGIVQLQIPDQDGTPFLASHLQALDYAAHLDKKPYFVRAWYQLGFEEPGANSVLQTMFDSPSVIDPNLRTIAVEITGYNFEAPGFMPGPQKLANTLAVVWALMKRYRIRVTDVLGHHEIQLGKSDPGKKFMGLIRVLIAVLALVEGDPTHYDLVFGPFQSGRDPLKQAIERYFTFARGYQVLVSNPKEVYEWEALTAYWFLRSICTTKEPELVGESPVGSPASGLSHEGLPQFLQPSPHEAADLLCAPNGEEIVTVAEGMCVYLGPTGHPHGKHAALFRHRQPDGADVVAVYAGLSELSNLSLGQVYPARTPAGRAAPIDPNHSAYLHFAVAYGASWDTYLRQTPLPPPNAGAGWIKKRYLNPIEYLNPASNPTKQYEKGFSHD